MNNPVTPRGAHLRHCLSRFVLFAALVLTPALRATVPWLHVSGNQIKDASGNAVTLRGVSLLAPEHNGECTTCGGSKPISEMLAWQADASRGWYSRIVRLCVTTAKVADPEHSFAEVIDPYVQLAVAKGLYVIVDLHYVSDFDAGSGTGVKQQTVLDFWNYVAPRYANTPNVLFEVYNEPINPDNWASWKAFIQPVVTAIRAVAPNNLILVGNPQWSTRVNAAVTDPIAGSNLVYVYHIYPNQGSPTTANLDSKFGTAAATIPVMITEFGWNQDANYSDGVTSGTTTAWGSGFRTYLDAHPHISWTSFLFDNYWKPQYFDWSWNLLSGENQGAYLQQWFADLKDTGQPQPAALTAAAVTAGTVNLTWPAAAGATGYNVKRATVSGGPYTTIATVSGITYADTALVAASTYYYVVSAVTAGGEGPDSAQASATTPAAGYFPDVPLNLAADAGNGQVALTWTASATGATSYNVKRATASGGPYTTIATGVLTNSYTDLTVTNGQLYYYVVSAVGAAESPNSGEVKDLPSSATVVVDNTDTTAVSLTGTWTTSTGTPGFYGTNYLHDGNTGATGGKSARFSPSLPVAGTYLVSARWPAAANRATNAPVDIAYAGGTTTLTLNQTSHGSQWVPLGVFSFNAGSTGSVLFRNDSANGYVCADAVKFSLTNGTLATPAAPSGLAGTTVSTSAVNLTWTDNSANETGFKLDRATNAAFTQNLVTTTLGANVTATSVTGLATGTTYYFRLRAYNAVGESVDSAAASVTTSAGSGPITSTVTVNQQSGGGAWNSVGSYSFSAGTAGSVTIRTTGTSGYVIADAVKFSLTGQADIILDSEGTAGITTVGTWTVSSNNPGYYGTGYKHDGNTGKGTKSVTYTPTLPVAGNWTVYVRWTADPNRATNVPVDIAHTP